MTDIDIWLVDSFTETPLTGNPATVILDPGDLTEEQFCRISSEVGVSESVCVFPPDSEGADFRLRFFSPRKEVDLCGHATVGAFWILAREGRLTLEDGVNRFVQETACGNLPVWVEANDGRPERVMMGQKIPRFEAPELNLDKIAALFGVGRKQVSEEHPVEIVSTGTRGLHIPLTGLSGFGDLRPLKRGITELCSSLEVDTIQVFTLEAEGEGVDAHCRVFAPALGIDEDPVTGTAAGALGAYLVRHGLMEEDKDGRTRFILEQGLEIGRPGLVYVEVDRDEEEFVGVRAGGSAVVSLHGKLRIA